MTTQQPYPPQPHYVPPAHNGLGLAALIVGLVGLVGLVGAVGVLVLPMILGALEILLGVVAVPLAIAGLGRVRGQQATNRGTAIAGLILGVAAIVGGLIVTVYVVTTW